MIHREFGRAHALERTPIARGTNDRGTRIQATDPALRFAPAFAHECENDRIRVRTGDDRL
jgi:hypothetical protein